MNKISNTDSRPDDAFKSVAPLTIALLRFTSFFLNKNWRFKLERSIVSRSSTVIFPKPVRTIFLTANGENSQAAARSPEATAPT